MMDGLTFFLRVLFVVLLCLPLVGLGWFFTRSLGKDVKDSHRKTP